MQSQGTRPHRHSSADWPLAQSPVRALRFCSGTCRPHSPRIVPLAWPTDAPGPGIYDVVSPRVYKKTNGNIVPRLDTTGERIVPLNPPTEGADAMYDPVEVTTCA